MMNSHGLCSIPPGDEWLLEEDWRRFFMGYLAGPVPENEMVKFKARGDIGGKAGVYYFVLFCLSIWMDMILAVKP
jgi:hypothetical protein